MPSVVNEPPQSTLAGAFVIADHVLDEMVYFQNVGVAPPLKAYKAPLTNINRAPAATFAGVVDIAAQAFVAGLYLQKSFAAPRNAYM